MNQPAPSGGDRSTNTLPAEQLKPWLKRAPLLPEAGAASTPLTAVIAVICFLGSLALASFFAVSGAAHEWTTDLRGSVTVQIKGEDRITIASDTDKAISFLRTADGIISARALSREETAELLEPWLGRGNVPSSLPIPGLIELEVSQQRRRDLTALEQELQAVSPRATIDDHGAWNDSLAASARTLQIFAFSVFSLILGAVCTVIVFATKAGLAANRDIVDVLHLVGATDKFIAREVQRRFVVLGFRGAAIGTIIGLIAVIAVGGLLRNEVTNSFFLPDFSTNAQLLFFFLAVPLVTCLVAAWTARTTVLQTLSERL